MFLLLTSLCGAIMLLLVGFETEAERQENNNFIWKLVHFLRFSVTTPLKYMPYKHPLLTLTPNAFAKIKPNEGVGWWEGEKMQTIVTE